jgi:hypothetical protein
METNWIYQSDKLYNIDKHLIKTQQTTIKLFFIYINNNNIIDKINSLNFDISNNTINNNKMFKIINDNKIFQKKYIYNFDYMNLFHIPFDHDKISEFNSTPPTLYNNKLFFQNLSINHDIVIPSTLFIFHPYNAIFLFYKQCIIENVPKSILITPQKKALTFKKTKKKVKICDTPNFRKTKKYT